MIQTIAAVHAARRKNFEVFMADLLKKAS